MQPWLSCGASASQPLRREAFLHALHRILSTTIASRPGAIKQQSEKDTIGIAGEPRAIATIALFVMQAKHETC